MYRFDWYEATVLEPPQVLREAVSDVLGGSWSVDRPGKGWSDAMTASTRYGAVCRAEWGGMNGRERDLVHVRATGSSAPALAELLRGGFTDSHYVTRADVAVDRDAPGAFDLLLAPFLEVCNRHRIKVPVAGDWHRAKDGRTQYAGGTSSQARVRLYEKGLQLRGQGDMTASPDLVRTELQLRPKLRDDRFLVAKLEPKHLWGFSSWSRDLLAALHGVDVPAVDRAKEPVTTLEQAIQAMVAQYGAKLFQWIEEEHGGCADDAVAAMLQMYLDGKRSVQ